MSGRNSQAEEIARRLNRYGGVAVAAAPTRQSTGKPLRDALDSLTSALNPVLSRSSHTGKLADDLQKADLKVKSSEWLLSVVGIGVLVGVIVAVRFGAVLLFIPCPIVVWVL